MLSGRFHAARIRLTLVYVAILAVILLFSSSVIYSTFASRLQFRFQRFPPNPAMEFPSDVIPPRQADVLADLTNLILLVNGLLLAAAGASSYWLAGVTLRPIQDAHDRQRRFLSDASHELRTPLAILQTDFENELGDVSLSVDAKDRSRSHLEEVERMGRIVNDLLTLSRLDEADARSAGSPAAFDINQTLRSTLERLRAMADAHSVALVPHLGDAALSVMADEHLVEQVLTNIIKNAIVYNTDRGSVTVDAKAEKTSAVITVTDTGIGIPAEEIEKVFDRFYRIDASRSRHTGGSGLGLPIVRSIMDRIDGSFSVESSVGKGTTVRLIFPLAGS